MIHQRLAVVAIGGNSLITDNTRPQLEYQWDAVRTTCTYLVDMVEQGWNVVVTHGNGPQVGFILRRNEIASGEVHTTTLDVIGADTQGSIGYMLQQAIGNEFRKRGIPRKSVAIITQTRVDPNDPAFENPTKPIGGFMTAAEAEIFRAEGWQVMEDAGRGYRRVVASPQPQEIMEREAIIDLIQRGYIVVAGGGGGIPVMENQNGELRGTYAVIDKDRATALLAVSLSADLLLISTGVEKVAINFGKPDEKWLDFAKKSEMEQYMAEGHFAPGSMKPKIEASLYYLDHVDFGAVIITDPPNISRAIQHETGTWITN